MAYTNLQKPPTKKNTAKKFLALVGKLLQFVLVVVLPFLVLIRGAVWLYEGFQWNAWLALLISAFCSFILTYLYLILMFRWLFGRRNITERGLKLKMLFTAILVVGYCGYCLYFLSETNTKSEEVREEFTELHPLLRVAVSTLVLVDADMLVTDFSRTHQDYGKMGLVVNSRSLHYVQKETGYVHAMDLRTNGRHEFRNWLLQAYFNIMGFDTLRHVGTADHLHVSLRVS